MEDLKKKLLVIGGTGFIGTNLLRKAKELNFEIYSLSTKEPSKINYIKNTKYFFIDTRKKNNLEKIFENNFQYIVNLAGYIDHRSIIDGGFPIITEQINLLNKIIPFIRNKDLIKFVQVGSSDEYGMNKSPLNETMRENPITPYSLARVFNTQYLQMLNFTEKLPIVILRLFLVYGPHQKFDRLVPQVINACLNNKIIDLSDGKQIKDFCYVSDVVDAIISCLNVKKISGQIFNIGSGKKTSVREIVEKIHVSIGSGYPRFNSKNTKKLENRELYPNISKSKKLIKWQPNTTLDEGLKLTIDWYSKII